MMQTSPPVRRRRGLAWLFFFIALVEAAAIVAFVADRALATTACATVGVVAPASAPAAAAADAMPLAAPPRDAVPTAATSASAQAGAASAAPAAAVAPSTAPDAAPATGDAPVQGDTNQIVDPTCVAKATVALLQASPPAATPSCGPMKQPEALKAAEKQVAP
jgi:hypothetical protein